MKIRWIKKGGLALTDQLLFSGGGFILSLLVARWLSPQEYGGYALAFSVFLFASSFHNAIILEPMGVIGPTSYAENLPAYVGRLTRLHTYVAGLLSLIIAIAAAVIFAHSGNGLLALPLLGVSFALPFVLLSWLLRQAAYLDHRPEMAVRGGATYAAALLLSLGAIHALGRFSSFMAFGVQVVAGTAAAVVMHFLLRPDSSPNTEITLGKIFARHWTYGRWVVMTTFVYWLSGQAYLFIAAGFLGMTEAATLRALQNFLLPLSQLVTCLTFLVIPWVAARFAKTEMHEFQGTIIKVSLLFTALGVVYFLFVIGFGSYAIKLIYSGKYLGSSSLLPILAISGGLIAAAQGPAIGLRAMQQPSGVFYGYAVSGGVSLAVGIPITRLWGLKGAVIGIAISSASFLVAVAWRYLVVLKRSSRGLAERSKPMRSDLRIAWLLPTMARAFYWQPLLKAFTQFYPDTIVFTGIWPGFLPGYESLNVKILPGLKFTEVKPQGEGYSQGYFRPPLRIGLELILHRPNVIFVNGFSLWTLFAVLAKLFTGCKIVLLWEGMSPTVTYLDSKWRLRLRRFLARFADVGISNMQQGVQYLRDHLGVPQYKLHHQPYEVPELQVIQVKQPEVSLDLGKDQVFLFVGSIIPRKGWKYLLEAADTLVKAGYRNFSIAIIGMGNESDELEQYIQTHQLEHIVTVQGQVDYQSLGAYMTTSAVFVFPTLEDTWGLVVLEALASGKPVLCSKYAGSSELIEPGVNGFVFDPRHPDELTQYMQMFLMDETLSTKMGSRAAEMMKDYTPVKAAQALAHLVAGQFISGYRKDPEISNNEFNLVSGDTE